jgi:flavorubredoxin
MDCRVSIKDKIHWIGVNDRETTLFENFWPLDKGVAYNSYLINDEKVVLVDTVKFNKTDQYIEKIKQIIGDRKVDYLIVNHMEPDHSGSMLAVIANYPDIKIIGNKKTFEFITNFYSIDTKYFFEVKEGDTLDFGHHKVKFFLTPMIHWPETMMTYDETTKTLFSMDAFGGFGALDGGIFDDEINYIEFYEDEIRRYYSNIVAKYSPIVQGALKN